jgi:tRNA 2-thiouridine synthesizing protein A
MNMVEAQETLDCLGLICPVPIVKLGKKIKEMEPDQVHELLADDEGALEDATA